MGTDEKGRLNLSRKDAMPKPEGYEERERRPRPNNNDRPRNNNGGDKFRENPNRRPYNRDEQKTEAPKVEAAPKVEETKVEAPAETESKGLFGFFKKK